MAKDAATPTPTPTLDMSKSIPIGSFSTGITSGPPSPAPTSSDTGMPSQDQVQRMAMVYDLDPDVINRQIMQESGGNPKAISKKGAQGVMQLMPDTAAALGVKDPFDPVQNMDGGMRLMSRLLGKYDGNYAKALAAYDSGEPNVDKAGGVPDINETQNYVNSILKGTKYESQLTPQAKTDNQPGIKLDMSKSIPLKMPVNMPVNTQSLLTAPGRFATNFDEAWGMPADIRQVPNVLERLTSGPIPTEIYGQSFPAAGPLNAGYNIINSAAQSSAAERQTAADNYSKASNLDQKSRAVMDYVIGSIPFFGPAINKSTKAFDNVDYAGGLGTLSGTALQLLSGNPELKARVASGLDTAGRYLFSKPKVQQTILGGEAQEALTHYKALAKNEVEASYEPTNAISADPTVTVPGFRVADSFNQALKDNIKGTDVVPGPMKEVVNETGLKPIGYMPNAQGQLREIFSKTSPDTPVSLKDLHGYYSELGDFLDRGNLPGDVYKAAKQARGDVGDMIGDLYKQHSTPGTTDLFNRWEDSQRLYEDYATRFLDPDSPLKKAIDEANPYNHLKAADRPAATLAHLTGDNETLARSYLNRYSHLGANDDIVSAAVKLQKGMNQLQLRGLLQASGGLLASYMLRSEGATAQLGAGVAGSLLARRLIGGYFGTRPTLSGLLSQMDVPPSAWRAFPLEEGGMGGGSAPIPPNAPIQGNPSPFGGGTPPVTSPETDLTPAEHTFLSSAANTITQSDLKADIQSITHPDLVNVDSASRIRGIMQIMKRDNIGYGAATKKYEEGFKKSDVMAQTPTTSRATPTGEATLFSGKNGQLPIELHTELEKQAGRKLSADEAIALDRANAERGMAAGKGEDIGSIREAHREKLEKKGR